MNIGIDIDDTLTDVKRHKKLKAAIQVNKDPMTFHLMQKSSHLNNLYTWTKENIGGQWLRLKYQFLKNVPVRTHAKEALTELKKAGHKIIIITKRMDPNAYSRSIQWLQKNNIPFDKLITHAGNKLKACKEYEIDYFLDNNVSLCDNLNKHGVKAYVLNNSYNYYKKGISKRVNSIRDFKEIVLQNDIGLEQ